MHDHPRGAPSRGSLAQARRVFEETLAQVQQHYVAPQDIMVEALARNADGHSVCVARYKLYTDGRIECFEILDDVLWPDVS